MSLRFFNQTNFQLSKPFKGFLYIGTYNQCFMCLSSSYEWLLPRQNGIPLGKVPRICILDPDGNLLDLFEKQE